MLHLVSFIIVGIYNISVLEKLDLYVVEFGNLVVLLSPNVLFSLASPALLDPPLRT
jgi:hypothetical protein